MMGEILTFVGRAKMMGEVLSFVGGAKMRRVMLTFVGAAQGSLREHSAYQLVP